MQEVLQLQHKRKLVVVGPGLTGQFRGVILGQIVWAVLVVKWTKRVVMEVLVGMQTSFFFLFIEGERDVV